MVKLKVLGMKQCIENPNELKWDKFWENKLKQKEDRGKDWDKAAPGFHKRAKKDNYHELLFSKLIIGENDSVLDLGCGEGSITLPLAKKVKKVTGVDSSTKMLEILNQRAKEQHIDNVETILKPLEDITYEEVGSHDVVLASRSLNGIIPIKKTLETINKIANKYVFITLFGPNNWKLEKDFFKYINSEYGGAPSYTILLNLLAEMDIYPNVVNLDVGPVRTYKTIEEAIDNGKWNLAKFTEEEQKLLPKYLESILEENKDGLLSNKDDKPDWVLIWWKK